jgi:DNA modification methylase
VAEEWIGEVKLECEGSEVVAHLRNSKSAEIAKFLKSIDWDFVNADTQHSRHGLFPYPAKFPPQIPEQLIVALTEPGELVLDCFSGSGTTALEAIRLGRNAWSIDANPVGTLVTLVKTTPFTEACEVALEGFLRHLPKGNWSARGAWWVPPIPNIDKWYAAHVVNELSRIRKLIFEILAGPARDTALAVFVNVAAKMSFQESETRYVSSPREIRQGDATKRFREDLSRTIAELNLTSIGDADCETVCADSRDIRSWPDTRSVSLVVTSPPYPNAYDYHLYHRFRIFWLGDDPKDLRSIEIGSHLKNQSDKRPTKSFEVGMKSVLANVETVLKIGGLGVFVVGDGIFRGQIYPTAERMKDLAIAAGLEFVCTINRNLPLNRRSVTPAGRRLQVEQVCVFRKPFERSLVRVPPTYRTFPYEEHLAELETRSLKGIRSRDSSGLGQAAFTHAWGDTETLQALAERDKVVRGKNSTYGTHGLHRYKGKFYPQLAKSLINIANPYDSNGLVCDPFGGSGTVATEAVLAGLDAISIDVSPLATEVARAKIGLLKVSNEVFFHQSEVLFRKLQRLSAKRSIEWEILHKDVWSEAESWFAPTVLAKLTSLLRAVDEVGLEDFPAVAAVWRVIVSDLIREVSHQDPSDLRIRRRLVPQTDAPVFEIFTKKLDRLLQKHFALQNRIDAGPTLGSATVIQGSSENFDSFIGVEKEMRPISAVVSSPPYGVALPYLDTDRLSLAVVYGYSTKARKVLEDQLIGSREVTRLEVGRLESALETTVELPDSTRDFLRSLLEAVRADPDAGFRKKHLPAVLTRYFIGMSRVLQQLSTRMVGGSEASFVVGESRSTIGGRRWVIPTVDEITSIAKFRGFALIERIPISVTREGLRNSHHAITENDVIRLYCEP